MPPKLRGAAALATANALATAAHTLATPPAVAPINAVPLIQADHMGTMVQLMQQMQQTNLQLLQAQQVAVVPPPPPQAITTLTEEGEKKKSWLVSRTLRRTL